MREIESLIEKSRKYLNSAELLHKSGDFDSSVSRSYYAMFFAAEAVLLTKSLEFSSHRGVISAFGRNFVKEGIFPTEMGKWLREAFNKRQKGDYEFELAINQEEADQLLQNAKIFVEKIVKHLSKEGYQL